MWSIWRSSLGLSQNTSNPHLKDVSTYCYFQIIPSYFCGTEHPRFSQLASHLQRPCVSSVVQLAGCGPSDYACQCGVGHEVIAAAAAQCLPKSCTNTADQRRMCLLPFHELRRIMLIFPSSLPSLSSRTSISSLASATSKASFSSLSSAPIRTHHSTSTSTNTTCSAAPRAQQGSQSGLGVGIPLAVLVGIVAGWPLFRFG